MTLDLAVAILRHDGLTALFDQVRIGRIEPEMALEALEICESAFGERVRAFIARIITQCDAS